MLCLEVGEISIGISAQLGDFSANHQQLRVDACLQLDGILATAADCHASRPWEVLQESGKVLCENQ